MDGHQKISTACDLVLKASDALTGHLQILDLACGGGRNGRHFLTLGHHVTFIDQDISALIDLADSPNAELITADLEMGAPWVLGNKKFDAVIVVNYLWRPIMRDILNSVKEGGLLIYETFAQGNAAYGRPANPKFLLDENELPDVVADDFSIIHYQHGYVECPKPAIKQSLIALKKL